LSFSLARRVLALCFALALVAPASAAAADEISDARQLTAGANYDRNPSVVVDGDDVWMFFARTQSACDRIETIGACNADETQYDLYMRHSSDGGQTFGPSTEVAPNPDPLPVPPPGFRGRTIAATQTDDGDIHVFWADGGSGGPAYHFRSDDGGATFDELSALDGTHHFNVEAVADGDDVLVYTQRNDGTGLEVRRRDGTSEIFGGPALIPNTENNTIPKVTRDASGTYRMVTSNNGAVDRATSTDGVVWSDPAPTIAAGAGVTHWDPTIAQAADGRFFLFDAPDLGNGSQKIDFRTSTDFTNWSGPTELTTGIEGTSNRYWDYWPEAAVIDGELTVFYTSERPGPGDTNAGTGHIFSQTITPEPPAAPADTDGDGIIDTRDCAANDPTKPASGGTDADCDGAVDPAPPSDRDGDGIDDSRDCNADDAARPAEDGTDADCDGHVDPVPQPTTSQQTGGGGTSGTATIISLCGAGTTAADLIVCGAERNVISGLAADDRLFGGDGDDRINGGDGDDTIGGGGGADRLNGQDDADGIDGGTGNDRISGGNGDDSAVGGAGNDRITGGRGNDAVRAGSGRDVINVRDRRGGDVVSCGSSRDTVVYDRGDVVSRDCERRLRRR
jgi:Ca2+-binding RTX toxin-like protein